MSNWQVDSWRQKPILQQPEYDDAAQLKQVEHTLSTYPPLVFAAEARDLPVSYTHLTLPTSDLV